MEITLNLGDLNRKVLSNSKCLLINGYLNYLSLIIEWYFRIFIIGNQDVTHHHLRQFSHMHQSRFLYYREPQTTIFSLGVGASRAPNNWCVDNRLEL